MKTLRKIRTIFKILKKAKWFLLFGALLLSVKLLSPYVISASQMFTSLQQKSDFLTAGPVNKVGYKGPEPAKPSSGSFSEQLPLYPTGSDDSPLILTVSYIDVGQGDSILLQFSDGRSILVDGGNRDKGTLVQKYLLDNGISRLDAVISTHGDADHCSGLRVICQKFDVDAFYMSYLDHDTNTYQELKRIINDKMIPAFTPLAGDTLDFGPAHIIFVNPVEGESESNAASLAFLLQYGSCSYLFCGDAENLAANVGSVDVLMAPHHGSYSGNDIERAVSFTDIVISASGIDYGHPHDSTMDLVKVSGANMYRTDKQGTIVSHCDGSSVWFDCDPCTDFSPGLDLGD